MHFSCLVEDEISDESMSYDCNLGNQYYGRHNSPLSKKHESDHQQSSLIMS